MIGTSCDETGTHTQIYDIQDARLSGHRNPCYKLTPPPTNAEGEELKCLSLSDNFYVAFSNLQDGR